MNTENIEHCIVTLDNYTFSNKARRELVDLLAHIEKIEKQLVKSMDKSIGLGVDNAKLREALEEIGNMHPHEYVGTAGIMRDIAQKALGDE